MNRRMLLALPGDPETKSGGYAYDRRILSELRALGWQADFLRLGDDFPEPDDTQKAEAERRLAQAPDDCPLVIDGLALGVLPEAAQNLSRRKRLVGLVHHPLALETGLSPARAAALAVSEREALSQMRAVIVTGAPMALILAEDYGVPPARITLAQPGTDRGTVAEGGRDGMVRLVSVGSIIARKAHDELVTALAPLADLPWHLTIVGERTDPEAVVRLDAAIAAGGVASRITVTGGIASERIDALLAGADAFVLASHFEGFGMAYAEAIVRGLPVIGTTGGSIPDTVPAEAGILVPPGDIDSLTAALRTLIANETARRRYATGARASADRFPTWQETARRFAGALERVT